MGACPDRADGVHDLGRGSTCSCGYEMHIPRFGYSLHVNDNDTRGTAVDDCFMTDSAETIADALERAARKMRALANAAGHRS